MLARLIDRVEESDAFQTVQWVGDAATGYLRLIDQTRLPTEYVEIDCRDVPTVWEAIKLAAGPGSAGDRRRGCLRGGDRGAVAGRSRRGGRPPSAGRGRRLAAHQPPDRRQSVLGAGPHGQPRSIAGKSMMMARRSSVGCFRGAVAIDEEDRAMCRAIGRHGAALVGRRAGRS